MTYNEATQWLFNQFPVYQNIGKKAYKADLSAILKIANYLKNPETKFKSIHVGGTNGKGSTSHILASILQEAGYKVGLYTSPHLKDYRERIKINGKPISKQSVCDFVINHKNFFTENKCSFFEMTVGLAFNYFATEQVDIAVIEVGLGGRLDSTNIITPEVSVITNIGLDHTQFLGNTLSKIAFEKAGIIKKNIPTVIGSTTPATKKVFQEVSNSQKSVLYFSENNIPCPYRTDLLGEYQKENTKTALQVIKLLLSQQWNIPEIALQNGFKNVISNTGLLGRWQQLSNKPLIICDTAHNTEGLKYTTAQITKQNYSQLHIILGFVEDKKLDQVLPLFPIKATYYFTQPNNSRTLSAIELEKKAKSFNLNGRCFNSVKEAFTEAKKQANLNDMIYIGGSTFVVAEIV